MLQTISLFAPQLVLAFFASQLLSTGAFAKKDISVGVRYFAVGVLVLYALIGFVLGQPTGTAFKGALIVDSYSHYMNFFLGMSAAAALMFSKSFFQTEKLDRFEFSVLVLYCTLGMSIMVSSNTLLSLYIGIEMQSLALYVMAAFNRDSLRASEAGLKYFVLGAISSGLLLYGASLIYGFTGSLEFTHIAQVVSEGATPGIIAGMVFLLCGLAFKISAAPFHMWTPDVYEGSPTPVTGFFAGAPKFAAMALIARLLVGPFGDITTQWQQVIIVLAVLSMFVGAIGALTQTNIKRLMAYSSIANMGYALVALSAGTQAGVKGMLIFMSIYTITVIGIFACILQMRIRNGMVEQISDLAGLSKTNRGLAIVLTMFMFSVMGIPPLLGFFGKFFAFIPAMEAGLTWLVVLALVASVIGAFYYLRLVKIMWGDENENEFVQAPKTLRGLAVITALLVFPLLLLPMISIPAQSWISQAAASLF
ncbi:NADH-quinone oxidoreductase subunit NuoN [Hellea balneolensis]|uniref:NADH-quinone oxidoreductase subunit NuoN n=1 Tax=Hellea balneolensis TaxID=287478 RepID=UPI00047C08C8|nr:NADH-quinone oxidoreductase subunit NuoN [Hellea balneolensis]